MTSSLILFTALFLETITKGFAHIGEPCHRIFRICLASNSYCDSGGICRCKSEYPVTVAPHSCRKGRHYGDQCKYPEECLYYDPNSYCTQLPYRSTCDCYTGFIYSESKQICEEIITETPKSSSLILPTAIGLSLAFASVLCCCMVLWHLCKRQNFRYWNFWSPNTFSGNSAHDQNQVEGHNSFLGNDEALPNYDIALTLKNPEEECDPPPSYEEVIRASADTGTKV